MIISVQSCLWRANRVSTAPHSQVLEGQPSSKGRDIKVVPATLYGLIKEAV